MFQTQWISKKIKYDGTQLRSLYAYLEHQVLGDSVIAFRGPCEISFDHMVDGEDLLEKAKIEGSDMIHFIFEFFEKPLLTGVLIQRLFASIAGHVLIGQKKSKIEILLHRQGDDLYDEDKKLSISIAARSPNSVMVHFAVNVSNQGTPVKTAALNDYGIDPEKFAKECMENFKAEYNSIVMATHKVRSVP